MKIKGSAELYFEDGPLGRVLGDERLEKAHGDQRFS